MQLPGFSIFQTIFTAISTAIISLVLIPKYYTPYVNFRQELIITYRYLRLHSNILTNKFQRSSVSIEFEKEVYDAQYDIRIAWTNLESKYLLIPKAERSLLTMLGKLPPKNKMEEISGELLLLSNSPVIFNTDSGSSEYHLQRRKSSIDKVEEFIKQYGIS